jgi:hypothetical protein
MSSALIVFYPSGGLETMPASDHPMVRQRDRMQQANFRDAASAATISGCKRRSRVSGSRMV